MSEPEEPEIGQGKSLRTSRSWLVGSRFAGRILAKLSLRGTGRPWSINESLSAIPHRLILPLDGVLSAGQTYVYQQLTLDPHRL
jgi:hypothetical protein